MRLIDADALLEEIKSFSMSITGAENAMTLVIMGEAKKSIAKMVDEQPTAYDVDKVVEQLEEESKAYGDPVGDYEFRRYCHGISAGYRFSIDIVKAGGVNG